MRFLLFRVFSMSIREHASLYGPLGVKFDMLVTLTFLPTGSPLQHLLHNPPPARIVAGGLLVNTRPPSLGLNDVESN